MTRSNDDPAAVAAVRKALRRELRARRRGMSPVERAAAARRIALHVQRHFPLHPGQRVGLYAPLPEELDITPLAAVIRRHGGRIFVPHIVDERRRRMRFREAVGPMRRNHLGILEPENGLTVAPRALSLVFVPLVGFDSRGMRLGMGAGYYDRAFAHRTLRQTWLQPRLIGVAFALQRVPPLTAAPHDVLLDAVVTEEGVLACRTGC